METFFAKFFFCLQEFLGETAWGKGEEEILHISRIPFYLSTHMLKAKPGSAAREEVRVRAKTFEFSIPTCPIRDFLYCSTAKRYPYCYICDTSVHQKD